MRKRVEEKSTKKHGGDERGNKERETGRNNSCSTLSTVIWQIKPKKGWKRLKGMAWMKNVEGKEKSTHPIWP